MRLGVAAILVLGVSALRDEIDRFALQAFGEFGCSCWVTHNSFATSGLRVKTSLFLSFTTFFEGTHLGGVEQADIDMLTQSPLGVRERERCKDA